MLFLAMTTFVACTTDSSSNEETNQEGESSGIVATSSEVSEKEPAVEAPAEDATNNTTKVSNTEKDGEEKGFAIMSFTKNEYNFGTVKEGDIVKHTFEFRNTGDVPLIITNATASCGCTVPDWPKEPIAPGAKSKIDVQFNSQGKPGNIHKTVTIEANTDPTRTMLQIKGTVNKVLDMNGPVKQ